MSTAKRFSEVVLELREREKNPRLVADWRTMIPQGSRWFPGCPGDPSCKTCEGMGYLRLEGLPIGHPYFGKIVLCDCVRPRP